jgi:hypothetical protein
MNKELTDQAVLHSRLHFQLVQPHIPRHINKKNYTIVTCHRNMRQSLSLSLSKQTQANLDIWVFLLEEIPHTSYSTPSPYPCNQGINFPS